MRKWIKILSMVLCLILSQVPVLEPVTTLQTVQAATTKTVKNGLKKENGQYYYYVKAVPKMAVAVPEKRVKRITTQHANQNVRHSQGKGKTRK